MIKKVFFVLIIILVILMTACPDIISTSNPESTPEETGESTPVAASKEVVNFPDKGIEKAIRRCINKPNGAIYLSDINGVTYLFARFLDISDITGLEKFSSLERLNLSSNCVSDLSLLANLTTLESLDLDFNIISDLSSLSGLISLKKLDLSFNNISDVSSLSGLNSLENLDLSSNNISDLSPLLAMNNNYMEVGVSGNPLSDDSINIVIPQLQARGWDVSYSYY